METATKLGKGKVIIDVVGEIENYLVKHMPVQNVTFLFQLLNLECFHSMLLGAPVQNVKDLE